MKNCKQESVKNQTQDPIHGSNNVINIPHQIIIKNEEKNFEVRTMLMLNR